MNVEELREYIESCGEDHWIHREPLYMSYPVFKELASSVGCTLEGGYPGEGLIGTLMGQSIYILEE